MGCDTKGLLLTPKKDVMLVMSIVERTLNRRIAEERDILFPQARPWDKEVTEQFQLVRVELAASSGMALVIFRFAGEDRRMHVFFDCDCDHEDLAPHSISFSMGCWGRSDFFMQSVLHALSMFGPVYFDHNDCDNIDMAPLAEAPLSILGALSLGYLTPWMAEKLAERIGEPALFPEGKLPLDILGVPYAALPQNSESTLRWDALVTLANQSAATSPEFLSEYHQKQAALGLMPEISA
jgi:hypothetical protein